MKNQHARALGIIFSFGTLAALAHAGPDWIEGQDAGSLIGSAQNTTGAGILHSIAGNLGGDDQEDCYQLIIRDANDIASPVNFQFQQGDPAFNPAIWLFDSEGFGVLGNDDDPILGGFGARLITPSTDGVTLLLAPGTYYLAVTESGNVPLSFSGGAGLGEGTFQEIFSFASSTEVSGPDGAGAYNPLAAWSGGAGSVGNYSIIITPSPATLGLFTLAGLGASRRRR